MPRGTESDDEFVDDDTGPTSRQRGSTGRRSGPSAARGASTSARGLTTGGGSISLDASGGHRASCHRCGNLRKRNVLCRACPHIYCQRCAEKIVIEYGPHIFTGARWANLHASVAAGTYAGRVVCRYAMASRKDLCG